MIKIKNNILKFLLGVSLVACFVACDEGGEPDAGATTTVEFSGDWWVVALDPDGVTPAFGGDFVQFSTYNTSANDNTFWLDDHDNWMQIKSKVTANSGALTFVGNPNELELYTNETVTVTSGIITTDSFTTASNTAVDEISFDAEFSWDPGVVYKFRGHKRTGFLEDENPHL